MNRSSLTVIGLTAALGASPAGWAADADSTIEEVIVTAQKRSENLRDVPVSISVLTEEEIERSGIASVKDVATSFSNVTTADIGSRASYNLLAIRGITSNLVSPQPRVAILIDDVPYTSILSTNALFDVEQIEVLRGPQSTLFGLTAEGGILNIKTAVPRTDKWGGKVSLQAAENNAFESTVSISGPVTERWSLGVSGFWESTDGFIHNAFDDRDLDRAQTKAGRIRSLFKPTEALSLDFVYAYQQIADDYGQAMVPLDVASFNSDFAGTGLFDGSLSKFETAINFPGFVELDMHDASLRAVYAASGFDFVSVTTYRKSDRLMGFDSNQTPLPYEPFPGFAIFSGGNEFPSEEYSQELRLVSNDEGRWSWVAGLFYYSGEQRLFQSFNDDVPLTADGDERETRAIFGDVKYRFANGIGLTGGMRYEESDAKGFVEFTILNPPVDGLAAETNDSAVLPRFVLDYKFPNENLVYASVSRGWLPGGVSISTPASRTFEPETTLAYELGAKTSMLDGRVRLNAAVFQSTIDDYQETTRELVITTILSNAEQARIRGMELDLLALITDRLELSAAYGFNDGEYTDFRNAGEDNTGNELPGVPRWNGNLALTYTSPPGLFARAQLVAAGKFRVLEDRANTFPLVDGYEVVNLSAGWDTDQWSVLGFVNNVQDKRYFITMYDQSVDGRLLGSIGCSREYGARVVWRF